MSFAVRFTPEAEDDLLRIPSFPRKRESSVFGATTLGPRLREDDRLFVAFYGILNNQETI